MRKTRLLSKLFFHRSSIKYSLLELRENSFNIYRSLGGNTSRNKNESDLWEEYSKHKDYCENFGRLTQVTMQRQWAQPIEYYASIRFRIGIAYCRLTRPILCRSQCRIGLMSGSCRTQIYAQSVTLQNAQMCFRPHLRMVVKRGMCACSKGFWLTEVCLW